MKKPVFLGVDAGTTKIKAALVDAAGETLSLVSRDAQVFKPQEGWCEMDMADLWVQLCRITAQLKEEAPEAFEAVAGIGITAQGDGLWAIDQAGEPVGRAMLWNDTRAKDLVLPHKAEIDQYLVEHHGTPVVVGSMPTSLAWTKANRPEDYRRIATVFHCKDWLNFKLTGIRATDYTDGSNEAMDVFTKEYLPQVFDLMGLPEVSAMRTPAYPSTHVLGGVCGEAAKATGLKEGTPVIVGAMDVTAVSLGVGVTRPGDGCSIVGTTLSNQVLIPQEQVDHRDTTGSSLCSILPGCFIRQMAALSGSSTIDWARSILVPGMDFAQIEEGLRQVPVGSNGVLYHPYIYGERTPFRNPDACGGFYGLTARHTRFDLLRGVYEGLILSMMDCYRHLPDTDGKVFLSGGGSQSDMLCQMIADGLGKEVSRPAARELGIYGIVSAVKVGIGYTDDYRPVMEGGYQVFRPNEENHRKMEALYPTFVELRESMTPYWAKRARGL